MSEEETKDKKTPALKTEKDKNGLVAAEAPVTIMPTMIDDSENAIEKKRDLSAIIPKSVQNSNEEGISLDSKDNELKSDGAISLATINDEGEATMLQNPELPEQIDIEERKKQAQKNKGVFKKEKKKKSNKVAQKTQNMTALGALIIIIGLGIFFYWYKNHPTEKDFKPLEVHVELGKKLPIRGTSYVKPGVGKEVDELQYAIDLKNVKVEVVGEYPFTVTYKNITKTGTVIVEDTTPPELEVKEYTIKEGGSYDASKFVIDCVDYSGCNYSFQSEDDAKYDAPGSYVVHVTATDAYENTTTKKASLIIESAGTLKKYVKYYEFSFDYGYEQSEEYDITYMDYDTYSAILRGTYTVIYKFQEESKYKEAVKSYSGEANYMFDDARMEITYTTKITSVGSNYTKLDDVEAFLKKEQFHEF